MERTIFKIKKPRKLLVFYDPNFQLNGVQQPPINHCSLSICWKFMIKMMICGLFLKILNVPWNNFIFVSGIVRNNFTTYYCKHAGKITFLQHLYNACVLQKRGKSILTTSPHKKRHTSKRVLHIFCLFCHDHYLCMHLVNPQDPLSVSSKNPCNIKWKV